MPDTANRREGEESALSPPAAAPLRFAGLILDLEACTLVRVSGEAITLTRGELALLRTFVARPGRVLTRDALLAATANRPLEPFDRSVDVLVGRLRRKIEPDPKEPTLIVTVPGEGYRFDGFGAKVPGAPPAEAKSEDGEPRTEAASTFADDDALASAPHPTPATGLRWQSLLAALTAALSILFVGAYLVGAPPFARHPERAAEDRLANAPRLSIVVLPFENAGGDPEQAFFADGITDDLTSDLSHLADAFVISRGTAFTYKGKTVDPKEVGRELGVRYVLEGSVRRLGESVTVNARLVSTNTGAELWADRFDGERGRLGELQARFVSRLANSLGVELVRAEALRGTQARPDNPDAVDLAMRGWAAYLSPWSGVSVNAAIAEFESAIKLDPNLTRAQIGLAEALVDRTLYLQAGNPAVDLPRAEALLKSALIKEPNNAWGHYAKANLLNGRRQSNDALAELNVALEIDPNFAAAYSSRGLTRLFLGHSAEDIAEQETALRLSPRDNNRNDWEFEICHAHSHMAEWEKAVEWCRKSIATNAENWWPWADLASAYAWLGRAEEAKAALDGLEKVMPGYTVRKWLDGGFPDNPTFQREFQRIAEGLRKAGLPEQ